MKTPKPSKQFVSAEEAQFLKMGEQLTTQYDKVIAGTVDIVVFGAMVAEVQRTLSTCGQSGHGIKGQGLKGWLEKYAPNVPRQRAYDFLKIAEGLSEAFRLPAKVNLASLLMSDAKDLSPAQKKLRESIVDAIAGKSRRQLLLHFGGVGVPDDDKKPTGGKHALGKPLTPEEEAAHRVEMATTLWKDTGMILGNFFSGIHHTVISKDQRTQLAAALRLALEKLEAVQD